MTSIPGIAGLRPYVAAGSLEAARSSSEWLRWFAFIHTIAASGLLLVLCGWSMFGAPAALGVGAGAVLIGGALIGVPHGSSDFLVAHRLFGPMLGHLWLPVFVLAYLAVVLVMLMAWSFVPFATLLAFLAISGVHFGMEDLGAYGIPRTPLRWIVRISTPLLPIVTFHLSEVAPFFATMSARDAGFVIATLEPYRAPLLAIWMAATMVTVLLDLWPSAAPRAECYIEGCELLALTTAAVLLPPLVTFAIYFCVVHAVRHMAELTAQFHPRNSGRALSLAALIIVPSAGICLVGLAASWSAIAGAVTTNALLCYALQVVAALTVPHMLLDALGDRLN